MATRAQYQGTGDGNARPFLVVGDTALPARDLDDAEYERLTDEQRAAIEASPLYKLRSTRAARAEVVVAPVLEAAVKDGA